MSNPLNKLAAEFNRYFTSSNGVDVPAKVSVSRDEWRALFTAIQQAESEPMYWEWRHQGSHPDAVDFGQWSEWKRVEPRSALHTVADALNEFRGYIARGHKYELRALYTHPATGVPDGLKLVPIVPTAKMLQAAFKVATPGALRAAWARMLAASPAQKGCE